MFITALCVSALTACQERSELQTEGVTSPISIEKPENIFRAKDVPHAELSGNVIPIAYRLDMRMNPDDKGFSGIVEIDVDIQKATDQIWLHAKHMSVSSTTAVSYTHLTLPTKA